jgi:hypothetical protein
MQNSLLSNHILDTDAPSTPLDITAAVKNTNVQLNWSPSEDNVGVVAYNVYQDGSVVATTSETEHKLLVDLSPLYFVFFLELVQWMRKEMNQEYLLYKLLLVKMRLLIQRHLPHRAIWMEQQAHTRYCYSGRLQQMIEK